MRIISGYIENFGCLSKKSFELKDGLNSMLSDNGTGKSTLAAFIKAMLYGIGDTKKMSLYENDRRRYMPWGGGSFGGSLTLECARGRYRIERSFGKRPSEDTYRLFNTVTGRECSDFSEKVGEELFGVDADGFERTAFLSEKNLSPDTSNPTVAARLSSPADTLAESERLDKALEVLEEQRKYYVKKGGGGKIDSLRAKIGELCRTLAALEPLEEKARGEEAALEGLSKRLGSLDGGVDSIRSKQTELVGGKRRGRTAVTLALIAGLALSAALFLLGATVNVLLYLPAAALGALSLILFFVRTRRGRASARSDFARLDGEREGLDLSRRELYEERAELISRHERTLDSLSRAYELRTSLEELKRELLLCEGELEIIRESSERLRAANESLASKHIGRAEKYFKGYLERLTETPNLNLDTSLKITRTEGGTTHPYEAYSRALRDLYSLAARLAAADALFTNETPFLILDDPFCAFDDGRLGAALTLVRNLAKERQIIYFTASRSRLP